MPTFKGENKQHLSDAVRASLGVGSHMVVDVDVVVIGTRLTGLPAARRLEGRGASVLVVEARTRVGGRVHSIDGPYGERLDLGGQWISPSQERMHDLIAEFGLSTIPTFTEGSNLEFRNGTGFPFDGALPLSDKDAAASTMSALLDLGLAALEIPLDDPARHPDASRLDAMSVLNWIDCNVPNISAQRMIASAVRAVMAAEPSEVSLLHFLHSTASGGGISNLISTKGGAQDSRILGGAQQLADLLASTLHYEVILSMEVQEVHHRDDDYVVNGNGESLTASAVLVALPPALAGTLRYRPGLPAGKAQLFQRFPMGSVIKIHIMYDRPFWRASGLSGHSFSTQSPVQVTFDNSWRGSDRGILLTFLEGADARLQWERSPTERKTLVLDHLASIFGAQALAPLSFHEIYWAEEEYSRGCYAGYLPPGVLTSLGGHRKSNIGNLYFASTETAPRWSGYMEGALLAGEEIAEIIIDDKERSGHHPWLPPRS